METSTSDLAQQLAAIPVFSDLSPEDVSWLASQMEVADFAARRSCDGGSDGPNHNRVSACLALSGDVETLADAWTKAGGRNVRPHPRDDNDRPAA